MQVTKEYLCFFDWTLIYLFLLKESLRLHVKLLPLQQYTCSCLFLWFSLWKYVIQYSFLYMFQDDTAYVIIQTCLFYHSLLLFTAESLFSNTSVPMVGILFPSDLPLTDCDGLLRTVEIYQTLRTTILLSLTQSLM